MSVPPVTAQQRANFRNLYLDILWWGVLSGTTIAFLAVYAARLGANAFQVSLLTAGPAVVNLFTSLPAGRWLEGRPLAPSTFWMAVLNRLGYWLLLPLPWLLAPEGEVWALILVTLLMAIPGATVTISFNALFAETVPPEWRSEVIGKRNAVMAVTMLASTLLAGWILDNLDWAYKYQLVFAMGGVGAMMSAYYVGQIVLPQAPDFDPRKLSPRAAIKALRRVAGVPTGQGNNGKSLLRAEVLRSPAGQFLFAYLVFYICQYLPASLFPLAFVNVLGLSDGTISVGNGLFHIVNLLVSLRVRALNLRFSSHALLVSGAFGYAFYPLILGLARGEGDFWLASVVGGFVWGVLGAATVSRLMDWAPQEERAGYMALHNLTLNLGILFGSLTGPLLGDWLGIPTALLVSAGLRAAAALLLHVWA